MIIKIAQPLWHHPTRVMLIDDDKKLLKEATDQIDPKFPFTAFTNPKEALKYLKQHVLPLANLSNEIITDIDPTNKDNLSAENISINFLPLRNSLDNASRFDCFVIAVVDKAMEEMDGLDFCRTVREQGLPVKLILLTGNAGDKDAISAFNDHIIDAFIKKSPDMMKEVNHHIHQLAFQEFCDSSTQLLGPILNKFPLLSQNEFSNFIEKIIQENDIDEYYVLDSSCGYLLITPEGKTKVLMNKFPIDFKNAYDIANADNADNTVLEALKHKTAFPFTGVKGSYYWSDPSQWKESMVPMKHHKDLDFYYAVLDVAPSENLLTFNRYVDEIWEPKIQ